MMLTATTRRCGACGGLVLDEQAACTVCGAVPCPAIESWPADVALWLSAMQLALYFRPLLHHTRQQRAEFLLRGVIAGHSWDGKLIRMAAPSLECYPVACEQAKRWSAIGKPREAETMIRIAKVGL